MKRGSLSLSVNAIVVLILAIVLLGLGLAFVTNLFQQAELSLTQKISEEPEAPTPSATNPITISRGALITYAGKEEVIKVSVYNNKNIDLDDKPGIDCTSSGLGQLTIQANAKKIAPTQWEKFNAVFTVPNAEPKTYLCNVGFPGMDPIFNQDITIQIKS